MFEITGKLHRATEKRFAIVASRFNEVYVAQLIEGAKDALQRHGVPEAQITLVRVPGAYEIPVVAKRLAHRADVDAVIALGVVIRGATPHFDFVAGEAASGLSRVALETDTPVSFGIVTTDTLEQATERCGSKAGNKGHCAALTAIEMVDVLEQIAPEKAYMHN